MHTCRIIDSSVYLSYFMKHKHTQMSIYIDIRATKSIKRMKILEVYIAAAVYINQGIENATLKKRCLRIDSSRLMYTSSEPMIGLIEFTIAVEMNESAVANLIRNGSDAFRTQKLHLFVDFEDGQNSKYLPAK